MLFRSRFRPRSGAGLLAKGAEGDSAKLRAQSSKFKVQSSKFKGSSRIPGGNSGPTMAGRLGGPHHGFMGEASRLTPEVAALRRPPAPWAKSHAPRRGCQRSGIAAVGIPPGWSRSPARPPATIWHATGVRSRAVPRCTGRVRFLADLPWGHEPTRPGAPSALFILPSAFRFKERARGAALRPRRGGPRTRVLSRRAARPWRLRGGSRGRVRRASRVGGTVPTGP